MGLSGSRTRKLVLVNDDADAKHGGALPEEIKQIMAEMGEAEGKPKVKNKEDYWDDRTTDLRNKHEEIGRIMQDEYKKAFEELGGRQPGRTTSYVPCAADTKKIIACYQKHPHEPMRCADVFRAFEECVTRERIEATECCCDENCECPE